MSSGFVDADVVIVNDPVVIHAASLPATTVEEPPPPYGYPFQPVRVVTPTKEVLQPAVPFMPEKDDHSVARLRSYPRGEAVSAGPPIKRFPSALDLAEDAPEEVLEAIKTPTKNGLKQEAAALPGAATYTEPPEMTIIF